MKYGFYMLFALLLAVGCQAGTPQKETVESVGNSFSADTTGYYASTAGLSGEKLAKKLHQIIRNHKVFPYYSDKKFLRQYGTTVGTREILVDLDIDPRNTDDVILFYTGRSQDLTWQDHGPRMDYQAKYGISIEDAWNREHLWPKSHGFPTMSDTAFSDVHALRPADRSVNSARGNRDLDWGGKKVSEASGCFVDFDSLYPRDAVKGDVARAIFYMDIRYNGGGRALNLEIANQTGTWGTKLGKLSTLLEWHLLDPPDNHEHRRNRLIWEKYQHNRNPFIDHPEYVAKIYGNPARSPDIRPSAERLKLGDVVLFQPSAPEEYILTATHLSSPVVITATEDIALSETSNGKYVSGLSISADKAVLNRRIYLVYTPSRTGEYSGKLILTASGAESVTIDVTARGVLAGSRILLETSFNDDEHGWSVINIAGSKTWELSSYGERKFMKINGYKDDMPNEDWLISPPIYLAGHRGITLSFESAKNHKDVIESIEVLLTTHSVIDSVIVAPMRLKPRLSKGRYKWEDSGYISLRAYNQPVWIIF
ncbi:MAG: endonuclease, partial [Candidatus Cloacimonetes bacterium]|nr:endonuclease [Candidatus Cloacimonadota bacterium]